MLSCWKSRGTRQADRETLGPDQRQKYNLDICGDRARQFIEAGRLCDAILELLQAEISAAAC